MNFFVFRPLVFLFLFSLAASGFAQPPGDILATAKGMTFRASDLSAEGQQLHSQRVTLISQNRRQLFDKMVFENAVALEAASRGTTSIAIEKEATAKLAEPTEAQIKAVYDANRATIGSRSIDEVRPQIVSFIRRGTDEKAFNELFVSLKARYKFVVGKDVNAAGLRASDVLATIGGKPITAGDFESRYKIQLYDFGANLTEQILADLDDAILNSLIQAEAKAEGIDASALIAREITNKLRDYSEQERIQLETLLKKRLFGKYEVKFLSNMPPPLIVNVSADDDPSIGNATAKVTMVAFVDFQCSACAAVSPVLKQVVSEYGGNVRLVYRDYPLTQLHANAFLAGRAGYAARQQGKFFEMADLMYRNQDALDMASLKRYAVQLGMNAAQFDRDMAGEAAAAEIRKDITDGDAVAVTGTPTIFVNGVKVYRLSAEKFRNAIEAALKR